MDLKNIPEDKQKYFRDAGGERKPFALPVVFRIDEKIQRRNTPEYDCATVTSRANWFASHKDGIDRVASDTQFSIDETIEALQAAKAMGLEYWRVSTFASHVPTPEAVKEKEAQADI